MKFTKKIAVYFLLSVFLFNTMGYFIVFKVAQCSIKSDIFFDIKQGISLEHATLITINKKDLANVEWKEGGKEMNYNDQMYDIVKSEEKATSITFYCINDKKEQQLFSHLSDHINSHVISTKPVKNHSSKTLVNDVVKIFFNHNQSFNLVITESSISFLSLKEDNVSEFIKTNSPPPRLV